MRARLPHPPLLLITDRSQSRRDLVETVVAACAGGCRWVSLREKDLSREEQIALLHRLRDALRPFAVTLTLHGRAELAAEAGADGVHLPAGADASAARARLGPGALIGLSLHLLEEASRVDPADLDYVTASPVFLTRSKPGYGPALGPEGLRTYVAAARMPVIALGGVDPLSTAACLRTGAHGVAVMGNVMRAPDPGAEMAALLAALAVTRNGPPGRD